MSRKIFKLDEEQFVKYTCPQEGDSIIFNNNDDHFFSKGMTYTLKLNPMFGYDSEKFYVTDDKYQNHYMGVDFIVSNFCKKDKGE